MVAAPGFDETTFLFIWDFSFIGSLSIRTSNEFFKQYLEISSLFNCKIDELLMTWSQKNRMNSVLFIFKDALTPIRDAE